MAVLKGLTSMFLGNGMLQEAIATDLIITNFYLFTSF